MSISCASDNYDSDDPDWWWRWHRETITLQTKRSRKCCSCGDKIKVGDAASRVERSRGPRNDIEEAIYGDEVTLAPWYLCEMCSDVALSLDELGFCFDLGGESLKEQIREYREMEKEL